MIRFDGPDGPDDPPPARATLDLLTDAIHAAAARVAVDVPPARYQGDPDQPARTEPGRTLRWGIQLDVQPIGAFGHGEEITEQAVASYVAKYATKAAETTGTVDRRISNKRPWPSSRCPSTRPGSSPHASTSTRSTRTGSYATIKIDGARRIPADALQDFVLGQLEEAA